MISVSPAGLSAAPVANQLAVLVSLRERLCRPFCIDSTVQPQSSVTYTTGTPRLVGSTVFVPVTAVLTIVTQGTCCKANTQLYTETFEAAFQGQTTVPTSVNIVSVGRVAEGYKVRCGKAYGYTLNASLTITIA